MRIIPAHRCVLVGVDGSPNSIAALHRAADEAKRRNARLEVIRVPGDRGHRLLSPARVAAWLRLRRLVARELPRTQHITTRLRIAYGSPAGLLIRAADRAELLVVGARGDASHGNLLGGDTVPRVLASSPCEVVVCAGQAHSELEA
ncbi:MAG TPA: universal stress protein [Streptosporangiaceae bacterium]|jgi:nucleotide-binding universal stress UspA family protein|nr:universal stress protein [Streptosporangiaceae bacterium]